MNTGKLDPPDPVQAHSAPIEGADAAEPAPDDPLQDLLDQVAEAPVAAAEPAPREPLGEVKLDAVTMRSARPLGVRGRTVRLQCQGIAEEVLAELGVGVSGELVEQARRNGDAVLIEVVAGQPPLVVGVLQTQIPRELTLKAQKIHIEADEEVLVRAGRGALRIRQDGDVELVGSRIAAFSRGLFRLVGRALRLN